MHRQIQERKLSPNLDPSHEILKVQLASVDPSSQSYDHDVQERLRHVKRCL